MNWEAWFTLLVVCAVFAGLVRGRIGSDLVLLGGLITLMVAAFVSGSDALPGPNEAISGLGNSGQVTVAALFVVVAGLVQTGAMFVIANPFLVLLAVYTISRRFVLRKSLPTTLPPS